VSPRYRSLAPKAPLLLLLTSACSAQGPSSSGRPPAELPTERDASPQERPVVPLDSQESSPSSQDVLLPVIPSDPEWGEADAPVTLVGFADLECPFSARALETLAALRKRYGRHELRIVFKSHPLPFHHQAQSAHEAAVAVYAIAGSEPFWRYTERIFSRQSELSPPSLEAWAEEVGVPRNELRRELESGRPAAQVAADLKLASELGVDGTPGFFINGIALRGAEAEEQFAAIIDRELAAAQDLYSSGAQKTAVYPLRFKENFRTLGVPVQKRRTEGLTVDPERARVQIPVLSTDPIRGSQDALVTIVLFSDFQCPFSRRTVATLAALEREYESQIRIVYKDNPLPFHMSAEAAAKVARYIHRERGNDAFWRAFGQIFTQQVKLQEARDTESLFGEVLSSAGLTLAAYKRASGEPLEKEIAESRKLALGVEAPSTPYFFINGRRLPGAQPLENFKKMLETELRIAERIVTEGTSRSAIYDALMETAEPQAP
jgi:protein-disulfide isomerase